MSIQQQLGEPDYISEGFEFYAGTESSVHYHDHRHAEIEIVLVLNAAEVHVAWQTSRNQHQERQLGSNQLCIIPSQQLHSLWWEDTAEYIFIFLRPTFLQRTAHDWVQGSSIELKEQYAIANSLIQSLALTMRSTLSAETLDHLYLDSLINVLVIHLLKTYADCQLTTPAPLKTASKQGLNKVIDYIDESLDQDLRLIKLAEVANMSESSFCHQFKARMGTSPHQYVIQQRIKRAKLLLLNRDLSIVEIAYRCGFNSQSHLTIYFRQHTGMTPNAYRTTHI
ncbi:Virulence regulon transcriptional activator VirF [Acaryochloris thomasi RCC1774]|uniref:Virulence regulon transcriptional activator VirF n=1 Tax=Acaryochloris thomasi RCC1774 TaxID=1764569 RepID=A0A2W1K0W0_9CYAN|nr:AraC family transcriptional regulator [Acaryochloris thomasi]PZD73847.1 Virulence regulon transcriptional activator VirF [Acaryochloris thomasi RCC1774]